MSVFPDFHSSLSFCPRSALPAILGLRVHCQAIRNYPARNSTTSLRAATFDFTRSGRLGVCEPMAERRQDAGGLEEPCNKILGNRYWTAKGQPRRSHQPPQSNRPARASKSCPSAGAGAQPPVRHLEIQSAQRLDDRFEKPLVIVPAGSKLI